MHDDHFGNTRNLRHTVYRVTNELLPGWCYVGKASDKPIDHLKKRIRDAEKEFYDFVREIKDGKWQKKTEEERKKKKQKYSAWIWHGMIESRFKKDPFYSFRIRILEEFQTDREASGRESFWQKESMKEWTLANDRIETGLIEERPVEFRSLIVRGKEVIYSDENELPVILRVSPSTFRIKRRKYPELDGLADACEESLKATEFSQRQWSLEGHEDLEYSNRRDLINSDHNEHRIQEDALQKRIEKARSEGKTIMKKTPISEYLSQFTEILPREIFAPNRKNWNKMRSVKLDIDGKTETVEGTLGELYTELEKRGNICYNGGPIPPYPSVQNRLNKNNPDSTEEAFGLIPPGRWAEHHERVSSGELRYFPQLGKKDWLQRHHNLQPILWEEGGIVFRGKGAICDFIRKRTGSGIDLKTLNKRLLRFTLDEIIRDRGINPDIS